MSNHSVDVTILTDARYTGTDPKDDYTANVYLEDGLVQKALEAAGLTTNRIAWSDKAFDWGTTRFALFRSTWDYFDRFDEFLPWVKRTKHRTLFINPHELIVWNLDKSYLEDLRQQDINTIPTVYCDKGDEKSMQSIAFKNKWKDIVIKPRVSGAAMDTHYISSDQLAAQQPLFLKLLHKQDMMVQEAQNYILRTGEVSIVMIGDQYSHAVLKVAKAGDFRVQDDFGGSVHHYQPTTEEIDFAKSVVNACSTPPLYARVDMIRDNNGQLSLVELELIEPELWFRKKPEAATALALKIASHIKEKALS